MTNNLFNIGFQAIYNKLDTPDLGHLVFYGVKTAEVVIA